MSELKDSIITLRQQGKTYTEIQKELGCSKGTISYHLGPGQKEKNVARRRVNKEKLRVHVQQLKQDTPCADCGENYPYYVMDFDHLRDKSFNISRFVREMGGTLEKLKKELEKCEVVCSNCHRSRTYTRKLSSDSSKETLDLTEYY